MTQPTYSKPSLRPDELVKKLKIRGMLFQDEAAAESYLAVINYYRLRPYWAVHEEPHPTLGHRFKKAIQFEEILSLYRFDRKLRLLVLDVLERFEIALRTRWAFVISQAAGAFAHEDPKLFSDPRTYRSGTPYISCHEKSLAKLTTAYRDSKEDFAVHHRAVYPQLKTPPAWVCCELMTLGELYWWLEGISSQSIRKDIARHFGFEPPFLFQFVRQTSIVRNVCAHHGRLWNRKLPFQPGTAQRTTFNTGLLNRNPAQNNLLYNFLATMKFIADQISPGHSWALRLTEWLKKDVSRLQHMGFPPTWELAFI